MAREAGITGYSRYRLIGSEKPGRRQLEPQALRVALRRFAGHPSELAVQMESRPSRTSGYFSQRNVAVEMTTDVGEDVQQVLGAH